MNGHEQEEALGLKLAQRAYLYGAFHLVFSGEPTEESARSMFAEQTREALAFAAALMGRDGLEAVAGRSLVAGAPTLGLLAQEGPQCVDAGAERLNDDGFVEELRSDYTRLLRVPGESYVYPWESPYLGQEAMMFQESTVDVRSYYHDAGLELAAEKHFPDDHIAAMMDYLHHQGLASYEAFADGDDAEAANLLAVQLEFLQRHVLTWVDDFAAKMLTNDARGYYGSLAGAMAAFTRADAEELPSVIEQIRQL